MDSIYASYKRCYGIIISYKSLYQGDYITLNNQEEQEEEYSELEKMVIGVIATPTDPDEILDEIYSSR